MEKVRILGTALVVLMILTGCGRRIEKSNAVELDQQSKTEIISSNLQQETGKEVISSETADQTNTNKDEANVPAQNSKPVSNIQSSNTSNQNSTSTQTKSNTQQVIELVKIGSSESEMLRILGNASYKSEIGSPLYEYGYGGSSIFVLYGNDGAKVVGWWNMSNNLKVTAGNIVEGSKPFTLGSSKEEVARVTGTPKIYDPYYYLSPGRWTYWEYSDGSRIDFDGNFKVIGWRNKGDLHVSLGIKRSGMPPVKLGSTIDDVTSAFGTPTELSSSSITGKTACLVYNNTGITFDKDGKVISWSSKGTYNINIGEKKPSAPNAVVGSSFQDVINSMGTPDSLTASSFNDKPYMLEYKFPYGKLVYNLDSRTQIVESWVKLDQDNHVIEGSSK